MSLPGFACVYLGLGANIGDRSGYIAQAIGRLNTLAETSVLRLSHVYESEPIGPVSQREFLNIVAEIETGLSPLALLRELKTIETELNRDPEGARWGPRTIDIDIVLWGDEQIALPELTVPHPEFRKRAFVLEPLRELAGDLLDPVTRQTVDALAGGEDVQGWVRNLGAWKG